MLGALESKEEFWWRGINESDYSWDGLAKKILYDFKTDTGKCQISFQDLFSSEKDRLILGPDGKYYTSFHLPLYVVVNNKLEETDKINWTISKWGEVNSWLASINKRLSAKMNRGNAYTYIENLHSLSSAGGSPTTIHIELVFDGMTLNSIPKRNGGASYKSKVRKLCVVNKYAFSVNEVVSSFENCLFLSEFIFDLPSSISFLNCTFKKEFDVKFIKEVKYISIIGCTVDFIIAINSQIERLTVSSKILRPHKCVFHDSDFQSADFTGSGWALMAGFDRATFNKNLKLDTAIVGIGADNYFKDFVLNPILKDHSLTRLMDKFTTKVAEQHARVNAREAALLRLEGAIIVLKKHYKDLWHEELSNRFYRFELWARENSPSAKGRFISKMYRRLSNYGYDLALPIYWIATLCLLMGFAYYVLYLTGVGKSVEINLESQVDTKFWDALSFSWGRIAPIIPWEAKDVTQTSDALPVILRGPGLVGLMAHMLAVGQTILTTGLIFLFGLAARRRFKIAD